MAVQNLLAVSLSLGVATASHAWYGWDNLPNSTFVAFESDLIWSEVEFEVLVNRADRCDRVFEKAVEMKIDHL